MENGGTSPMGRGPDLTTGFIRNHGDGNSWTTEIQSILVTDGGDGRQTYYLSQECRNEAVPLSRNTTTPKDQIFLPNRPFEFLTCTIGEQFHQLVCQDFIVNSRLYQSIGGRQEFHVNHLTPPMGKSEVYCQEAEISYLSPQTVAEELGGEDARIRDLFVEVSWTAGSDGAAMILYAPCRYVNFGESSESGSYVQPITGQVLFVDERGAVFPAYLAAALDGTRTITEFLTPHYRNAFALLAQAYQGETELMAMAEPLTNEFPLAVRTMDRAITVDGTVRLFRYVR